MAKTISIKQLVTVTLLLGILIIAGCSQAKKTPTNESQQPTMKQVVQPKTKIKKAKVKTTRKNVQVANRNTANQGQVTKQKATQPPVKPQLTTKTLTAELQASDFTKLPGYWSVSAQSIVPAGKRVSLNNLPTGQNNQIAASTIKIFIALACMDAVSRKTMDLDKIHVLQGSEQVGGSGVLLEEKPGKRNSLRELIDLMLTESDNTATNILIDELGIAAGTDSFVVLDQYLTKLGYQNTQIQRKLMDLSNWSNGKSNRISADDACDVLVRLYRQELPNITSNQRTWLLSLMQRTQNREKLPSRLATDVVCYNKSGESTYKGVENDLAIIERNGQVFAVAGLSQYFDPSQPESHQLLDQEYYAYPDKTKQQLVAFGKLGNQLANYYFTD